MSSAIGFPECAPKGIAGALCMGVYACPVHLDVICKHMTHSESCLDTTPTPTLTGSTKMLKSLGIPRPVSTPLKSAASICDRTMLAKEVDKRKNSGVAIWTMV